MRGFERVLKKVCCVLHRPVWEGVVTGVLQEGGRSLGVRGVERVPES